MIPELQKRISQLENEVAALRESEHQNRRGILELREELGLSRPEKAAYPTPDECGPRLAATEVGGRRY